ncbi:MAG: DUF819 family protein [Candidatus Marinimicrobia bacterium]|nr:DUF819 family protein [Candidatus Neomarinimicrobiota bacterium]
MLSTILWSVFFLACPAFILWICSKNKFLDSVGAIVLCYGVGLLIGNIGIFPENIFDVQDTFNMLVIPIALPLIFFSMDLRGWGKQAGMAAKSFGGALVSVILASFIAYVIFSPNLGGEAWKMAGMLIGCYSGGTPNLAAIGTGLEISSVNYISVHTADVFVGGVLLLLILTVIPRALKKILRPFKNVEEIEDTHENSLKHESFEPYFKGFRKKNFFPLLGAFGLAILIFGIGGGASFLVPEGISSVVAILIITTLGILASFIPKIRNIRMTFQLGHYFLLVFALVVSSMADITKLVDTAPNVILYVAVLLALSFVIHTIVSKLTKVDRDTHLVAMTALVYSPPFVPVVAAVLKNKQVIMTGMLVGITGWIIGNYAGIGFAYLMQLIFG